MSTPDARTPHSEQPSEGAVSPGDDGAEGRTPHAEVPAEGPDDPAT